MSFSSENLSARRVSDALNIEEIERILATIPENPVLAPTEDHTHGLEHAAPPSHTRNNHPLPASEISKPGSPTSNTNISGTASPTNEKWSFNPRKSRRKSVGINSSNELEAPRSVHHVNSDSVLSPVTHDSKHFSSILQKPDAADGNAQPTVIVPSPFPEILHETIAHGFGDARIPTILKPEGISAFSHPDNKPRNERDSQNPAVLRTRCLEVIYSSSCRARDGTPMDHQVLVPRQQTMECSPPTGIAVANEEVVVTHLCYGTRGETLEAQQDSERQDEEPPVPSSALPYHGGVINTKQWNPMCLQMCALFIPLLFFIIAFITQRNTIVTTSSKNVLVIGDLFASLSAYLVEEQAIASYMNAFITRVEAAADRTQFYADLDVAKQTYSEAQERVNDVIAQIQVQIGSHGVDFQKKLGSDVPISIFISSIDLSTVRVRALISSYNGDIMMRYENIITNVLIFRGIFLFQESIRTSSEMKQTRNLFANSALYLGKSLELYFKYLGLGIAMPSPTEVREIYFLELLVGGIRVLERTFLLPSDPEALGMLRTASDNTVNTLEVNLPSEIENVILEMLSNTVKATGADTYDLVKGDEIFNRVTTILPAMDPMLAPLKKKIEKYRTTSDLVGLLCLSISFALACIGLVWHALFVCFFRSSIGRYKQVNTTAVEMRASVIRMHDATMKMTHMDVKEMSNELAVVENKKLKGNNEERELYLGNRTMVELEPYLPLPMVAPPVGAPAESLLYKSAFVRPTLIARRNLVGVRMSFSYLTSTSRDMVSMFGDSYVLSNSISMIKGFTGQLQLPRSGSVIGTLEDSSGKPSRSGKEMRKNRKYGNFQREVQYFERTTQIIKFAAAVSNEVLTQSERGAYMSVCGEDVVLWINVCEKISNASLLAFVIAQSILEYCDRCNLDAPGIALCRGDAVLGNVTSYSPGGPVAANDGEWTQDIIFDPDYDDAICASDLGNTVNSHWKDFVTATEGMTAKRRLKEWLRQLFGVKEKSEKDESSVMDYMESFRGRRWNKKLEEDESDNEFEVDLPKELKEDQKPKESATTVTSFVVYGDVLQEMEMSLEVCRSHGQHVVANEAFVKAFLLDRAKAEEVLEKLSQLRTESKAVHSQAASLFRLPDGTVGSAFSPVMADPKRAQDSVKSAHDASSRPREIVAMVIATLLKAGQQIAPLDMLEVRRRSIVLSVEEVLTAKEKRRREKEAARLARQHHTKEGESGAVDPTGISGMAQRTEPMETSEVDTDRDGPEEPVHTELFSETDDDEAIDGFTALNRCVDVSASVTRVENNQATTSKSQCELHAYYALVLDKSEGVSPASERSFSQSLGSSRAWRLTENPMVVREWDELMRRVVEMYYVAEATSFGQDHSQVESSQLSGLIQGVETLLRKFFNSHPHSVYAKLSTPRILDVVRAVKVMAETAGGLPVGLQQMSPFSLEALLICRLHISTANV